MVAVERLLAGLPEHVRRKITRENVAKLYRLSSVRRSAA
jgi:hypothetical protein